MSIENRIGPPVEGKDFYGREKELGIANRLLDSGHSLLLSAPRRIGKSSFAKRLIEDKKSAGMEMRVYRFGTDYHRGRFPVFDYRIF